MYCKKCGQQLDGFESHCPNCGAPTEETNTAPSAPAKKESNTIALVGFILSFFVALPGLICSIIGYRKAKNEGLDRGGLALAGIIISAISMVIGFIGGMLYAQVLTELFATMY